MKRQPVEAEPVPDYPRREEIDAEALAELVPRRWQTSGKVAAGMAILFATPGAARADAIVPPEKTPPGKTDETPPSAANPKAAPKLPTVFEHGEGRGAFGCVAVAPPAFLTEADARQVILEEFAKVGVRFELDRKVVPGLRRREVSTTYREKKTGGFDEVNKEKDLGPLTLDGYDGAHNVGFEYISEGDYFTLGGARSSSTVQSYDFRPLARRLGEEARRDGTVKVGVFYDPMARAEWQETADGNYKASENTRGKAELRAQVKDFVNWLRKEGVIQ